MRKSQMNPASDKSPSRRKVTVLSKVRPSRAACRDGCAGRGQPLVADDEWNHTVRGELPMQRLDRSYAEILQEVRVAQTGVQCLLAFLLTLAFTPRFATLNAGQLRLYIATLVLGAGATALLMAPAAFHRMVFRRRLKRQLVTAANRFALFGLAVLLAAKGCAILLILDVVIGLGPAAAVTAGVVSWFAGVWFAIPAWCRYHNRPRAGHDHHDHAHNHEMAASA
jgi:hypothetical protein